MTPASDQPHASDIVEALAATLDQIDSGELEATTAQRAYIAGARDSLAGLVDDPANGSSTP